MKIETIDYFRLRDLISFKLKEKGGEQAKILNFCKGDIRKFFSFPVDLKTDIEQYANCAATHFEHVLRDYNLTLKDVYFNIDNFEVVSKIDDIEEICRGSIIFRERRQNNGI